MVINNIVINLLVNFYYIEILKWVIVIVFIMIVDVGVIKFIKLDVDW